MTSESRRSRWYCQLRSEWFPGWHVGVLPGGREANDTALYLTGYEHRWTLQTGQEHPDFLGLSYYAFGQELASNRGYYSADGALAPDRPVGGQYWTKSTASHNLVLVDEKCQPPWALAGSNLELFEVTPGIEVVQASGFNVYPQCEEYRRTSVLIWAPGEQSYVVSSGSGAVRTASIGSTATARWWMQPAEPTPQPVVLPLAWDEWAYTGWVKNPRFVTPEAPYTFTWKSDDVNLDLMLLNAGDRLDRILIVDAPGWRHQTPPSELGTS